MALGKPIIGVLKGEGQRLILESNSGVVEENYNYVELAKKINSFASKSKAELIEQGNNAKKYYYENFSSQIRKREILNLIYE